MLDTWTLQVLVEVAERGSFSAAAEAMHLTQPAVSRQIAGLERRLGLALFRRVPRGVRPTAAGAAAVERARDVLGRLRAMEAHLSSYATLDAGQLRLSAFPSANTALVPAAIREFGAAHPGVRLSLVTTGPEGPLPAVREGHVDLALLTDWNLYADPHEAKVAEDRAALALAPVEDIDLVPLLDEELRVAVPAGHRLARRRRIRLADLGDETWIEGAHPDCLGPIFPLAAALGGAPRVGFTCDDWNGKLALVAAGAGVTLVPTLAGTAIPAGVVLRPSVPALPTRRLFAAAAPPAFRAPAVTAMLDVLVRLTAGGRPGRGEPAP